MALNGLVDNRRDSATFAGFGAGPGHVIVLDVCQGKAVFDGTAGILLNADTLVDGTGENSRVPTVQKVTVETESSGIAVREGEFSAILVDGGDTVKNLEEQVRQLHRVLG